MQSYSPEIERAMKKYYATLSEKDRRRYAAIEALKLGHGGQRYIAQLLGCSEKTVSRGLDDLAGLPEQPQYEARSISATSTATVTYAPCKNCIPTTMTSTVMPKGSLFRMGFTTCSAISAICI